MNLQEHIRKVLREEYIPAETEYLGWDIPRKLYDELEDIGIKRWDKENDKVYIAEFQFDTKSVVFEILDSTGEAYSNSLFPIPLSYKSYHTKKIKDLPISIKYFIRRRFEQEWVNIMDKYDDDGKIIQESIRRVLREEISKSKFFRRRIPLDKVENLLRDYASQVFYETESYSQFKYELTLKAVEWIMWDEYKMGWEDLPEQEEIEFVTEVSDMFEDIIINLYKIIRSK